MEDAVKEVIWIICF
jgi:hypothetical protein